jgi:Xaa-Pro aminopeptidase
LYYLTGYQEPDAVLVLDPASENPFTMFVRDRDPERELWMGKRAGVEGARTSFGAQYALNIAELPQQLPKLLAKANTVYARPSARPDFDAVLQQLFAQGRSMRARTGRGPHILRDPGDILDPMRIIKDDEEVELIRTAARISAEAFAETLPRAKPGMGEWEIEAMLEFGFRSRGASGPAFPTISATGGNATVLHYIECGGQLQDGDLLLLDAGGRYQMYCADITRTVPVSGKFNPQQRDLYDVVLAAHDAAIAAVAPGLPVDGIHAAARQTLIDGLVRLGLLRKEQREDDAALKAFYPHKTSHWLGLEVHDVGLYAREDESMLLQPGMVLTIEPGLYLAEQGTGIRVEDDVLVTTNGHEVLTASLPSRADAIEALLR